MLNRNQRRLIFLEINRIINHNPNGINTRDLITQVILNLRVGIPNLNRYHVSGMLAWILKCTSHKLLVRKPGYSIIA